MYLKHLTLQGFKTFATRTEFEFAPGITAIVGPNGSGKSNVADAIRWVLGEQSLRPLRIKRTEDVIFAGSSSRARQGLAEVSITLDNSDGRLPLAFSEVTITRRAYRSGENEYRINNNRVRLRDLQELLGQAQLGQSTYMVIGQGMIDEVLSLRPEERRGLFEEAAGIGHYQRKRREAAARLEATEANILRVNDILNELGPRLQRLQRQAQRAQDYTALTDELQELLVLWYGQRWEEHQQARLLAVTQESEAAARLKAGRKLLADLEQRADKLRERQLQLRESLEGWHRQSSTLHAEAEARQRDLAVRAERRAALQRQVEALQGELPALIAAREDEERRAGAVEALLAQLGAGRAELETRLAAVEERWAQQQRQRAALEQELATAQDTAYRQATALAQVRHQLAQIAERRAERQQEQQELERARAQAEVACATHRERAAAAQAQAESLRQRAAALAGQQARLETQAADVAARLAGLTDRLQAVERERHALTGRLQLLSGLRESYAGPYGHEGLRRVVQAGLPGIVGPVISLMTAPPALDLALEAALGQRLQDLVVETWADAERAIALLRREGAGRVTFWPLDTLRVPDTPAAVPQGEGIVGRASDLIAGEPRCAAVFAALLGRTLVVDDLPTARQVLLASRTGLAPIPDVDRIVTLQGEVVDISGAVTGGTAGAEKTGQPGGLALEREWRELPGRIAALDEDQHTCQAELDTWHASRETLLAEAAALAQKIRDLTAEQAAQEALGAEEGRAAERLGQELGQHQTRLAQIATELEALEARETDLRREAEATGERQQASQALVETLRRQMHALQERDGELAAELAAAQTALAVSQEEERSHRAMLAAHQASRQRLAGQIAAREEQIATLGKQMAVLETEISEAEATHATLSERLAALAAAIEPAEAGLRNLEAERDDLAERIAAARRDLLHLETEARRAELEVSRCQEALDALRHRAEAELEEFAWEQPHQLRLRFESADAGIMLPAGPALAPRMAALEKRIAALRREIKAAGAINLEAPAEYQEALGRYTFLSTQVEDLTAAAKSLRVIIAELDAVMQREFDRTFAAIGQEFRRHFVQLFGGGTARLLLTGAEDPRQAGVEIVARPPGKREQGLALLSGGERSLTALALLFAILTVNPTPFCVLDEVDAALDEPNARRFRQALQALAGRTQFAIITHNRVTMEAANALYGVSLGEDSVSRVLSLKLDEVTDETLGGGSP